MQLIGNNCISAMCYKKAGMLYNNPFMWAMTSYSDLAKLITNKIHWDKIVLEPTRYPRVKNRAYDLIVDKQIRIAYAHYLIDYFHDTPTKHGIDTLYNRIYEYVVEKYISRTKRFLKCNEPKTFLLSWYPASGSIESMCQTAEVLKQNNQSFIVIASTHSDCDCLYELYPNNILQSHAVIDNDWVGHTADELYKQIIERTMI